MTQPPKSSTFYERMGGDSGVKKLVSAYMRILQSDPQATELLKCYERISLERYETRLGEFLSGWLGGPALYQSNHGMPMLRESHRSIRISRSLMIAWVGCMQKALEETVEDPALRLHLAGRLTRLAVILVNA